MSGLTTSRSIHPVWVLVTVCSAQLLMLLDGTIMIIALPSIGQGLDMGPDTLPWVVTAYALTFGSLLLLGGRIADYRGRRRAFLIGMVGFVAASALGGAAQDGGVLIAARAMQGAFAALVVPAILSLISVIFTSPAERTRAFTVYGAVSGMGIALGMILGGVLTEYASWRWCLLVNVPVGALLLASAVLCLPESRLASRIGYDVHGALLATAGIGALVYGFAHAASNAWSDWETIVSLIGSAILLVVFAVWESRVQNPLLPPRLVRDPQRLGSLIAIMVAFMAIPAWLIFLVYFFQGVKSYSAVESGFAVLPYALACMVVAAATEKRLGRMEPRYPVSVGLIIGALGVGWFTFLDPDWDYASHILPGVALMGAGVIITYIAAASITQAGVDDTDTGVMSALFSGAQQVGVAVGTALLTTIATKVTENSTGGDVPTAGDLVDGYSAGILGAAVLLVMGASISWFVMKRVPQAERISNVPVVQAVDGDE